MKQSKVDIFLTTGKAECKHHGIHSEWSYKDCKTKLKKGRLNKYRAVQCRKCIRERSKKFNALNPNAQDDYRFSLNGTIVRMLAQARIRARKKGYEFELDSEWVKERFKIQNYKCAYSGITFDFSRPEYDTNRKYLPSIDQKIAGLGYTKENSQVVCSIVNMMKLDTPFNDFISICETIVKYNKR